MRPRPYAWWLFFLAPGSLAGCAAGYPPANSPDDRENDLVAKRAAQVEIAKRQASDGLSSAAEELEAELFLTDSGKVIARAIRAHGGWDAWTALSGVNYVRDRILLDENGQPVTGPQKEGQKIELKVDSSGRFAPAATPEAAEEQMHFALPFLLAYMEGRKDYLGVEADAKTDDLYEKIRCDRGKAAGGGRLTAYFDYSSFVLRRLLEEQDGKFSLTVYSNWTDVGGIKVPTKRSIFRLHGRFEHRDLRRADEIEVLEELRTDR